MGSLFCMASYGVAGVWCGKCDVCNLLWSRCSRGDGAQECLCRVSHSLGACRASAAPGFLPLAGEVVQ